MTLTAAQLQRFADAIEVRFGIRVGDRGSAVADIVGRRAAAHVEDTTTYLRRIERGDAAELRALGAEITIGESYFFRHIEQFQAYADLLPQLAMRGPVRVLSAGCSSGEEPYTLAMISFDKLPAAGAFTVDAIDVSGAALERARCGRYSRWALRATSPEQEARWFEHEGRDLVVTRRIRDAVTFAEANLNESGAWTKRRWDVVFCRNVLMYFGRERGAAAIARLIDVLAPGGYLFVGHAETLRDYATIDLELCHAHGSFFYRRTEQARPRVALPSPMPVVAGAMPVDASWVGDIAAASARVSAIVDSALSHVPADALAPIRTMIGEERFSDAIGALDELAPAVGRSAGARLLRAIVASQTGDATTTVATCRELLAAGEHAASASYLLAVAADGTGDLEASARHAEEAAAADSTFAMASVQLAFLARRRHDRERSKLHLRRAIDLLQLEDPARLALFGGGFGREALIRLCKSELDRD